MSKLGKALPPAIMGAAIVVAFGVLLFLTVWYGEDRWSSRKSISIGSIVLLAGCGSVR